MALFQPAAGEEIVVSKKAMYYKSKLQAFPGVIHVTNKRLVWERFAMPGSGILIQMIVKSHRAGIVFAVPFDQIKKISYSEKKFGLGMWKKIIVEIGDQKFDLKVDEMDDLLPALPNVVAAEAE